LKEKLYIGARQILGSGGKRSDLHGLGALAEKFVIPPWVDRERIQSANLWAGAGDNHTLLHFDPWDGVLMLGQGYKRFILIPDTQTSKLQAYSALDFPALLKGKVLHSKISPLNVQKRYQKNFSKVEGVMQGDLNPGEMIFIPVGFWHYVESSGQNIGVNFFIHFKDRKLNWSEPMRTYWIKDNITLWPTRYYKRIRAAVVRQVRKRFPKKISKT
jgi:hypothetical protein